MYPRYTKLKLKLLIRVILGSAAALGLTLLCKWLIFEGLFQDGVARITTWGLEVMFNKTPEHALAIYQTAVQDYKTAWLLLLTIVLMWIGFYSVMGRFTRWLDDIAKVASQVSSESQLPIQLPKELRPMEVHFHTIQRTLQMREAATRESEQRRQDLISFLAHDLKTPMTSVIGYLTLLRDEPDLPPEERAKFTGIVLDKSLRLEELVSEFFDITRMSLSQNEDWVEIQLSMLLAQMVDECHPACAKTQITCTSQIAPQLTVRGDPDKLARVFDNILRNAIDYSIPEGKMSLTATEMEDWVEVCICNEGLEIPEGELTKIFQKFYRLDQARSTRTGGSGLGLAIAKEIVEYHGGTIRAESNGKQTAFTIKLPKSPLQS